MEDMVTSEAVAERIDAAIQEFEPLACEWVGILTCLEPLTRLSPYAHPGARSLLAFVERLLRDEPAASTSQFLLELATFACQAVPSADCPLVGLLLAAHLAAKRPSPSTDVSLLPPAIATAITCPRRSIEPLCGQPVLLVLVDDATDPLSCVSKYAKQLQKEVRVVVLAQTAGDLPVPDPGVVLLFSSAHLATQEQLEALTDTLQAWRVLSNPPVCFLSVVAAEAHRLPRRVFRICSSVVLETHTSKPTGVTHHRHEADDTLASQVGRGTTDSGSGAKAVSDCCGSSGSVSRGVRGQRTNGACWLVEAVALDTN